jgi:hypothetical protein
VSRSDRDLLAGLARHLRKHEVGCFDPDDDNEQSRAETLIEWFADSVDVLNVPDRGDGARCGRVDGQSGEPYGICGRDPGHRGRHVEMRDGSIRAEWGAA